MPSLPAHASWLLAIALVACSGEDAGRSAETKDVAGPSQRGVAEPDLRSPAPVEPLAASPFDDVFFATSRGLLTRLDESGTLVVVWTSAEPVADLTLGPRYELYAVAQDRVWVFEGGDGRELPPAPGIGRAIAVSPTGEPWLLTSDGVTRLEGDQWRTLSDARPASLRQGTEIDLVVDAEGTPWLLGMDGIARLRGETFEGVAAPAAGARFSRFLHAPGHALVLLRADQGGLLHRWNGARWEDVELGGVAMVLASAAPPGIEIAAYGSEGTLVVCDHAERCHAVGTHGYQSYAASGVRAVTADGSSRLWIATETGLRIERPGRPTVTWAASAVPALDGTVLRMLARGSGPATLPELSAALPSTVAGTMFRGASPVADAKITLCPRPAPVLDSAGGPCVRQDPVYTARTGPDGSFAFTGVEAGRYGLALEESPAHHWVLRIDCCEEAREGKVVDLGRLELLRGDRARGPRDWPEHDHDVIDPAVLRAKDEADEKAEDEALAAE